MPFQPSLRAMTRDGKAGPEKVEAAVEAIFPGVRRVRKGRLLLYAQRMHSGLGASDIGRRYGRSHTAARMAVRHVEAAARRAAALASRLAALSERHGPGH